MEARKRAKDRQRDRAHQGDRAIKAGVGQVNHIARQGDRAKQRGEQAIKVEQKRVTEQARRKQDRRDRDQAREV